MSKAISNVTLIKQKGKSITAFPSIGILKDNTDIATGLVILFTACKTGSVLRNGNNIIYSVGYHSTHWAMESFECHNDKVTLQNKEG